MTNDEEDPDLEIYGTSPGVIAWFMILISIFVPFGVIPFNSFIIFGSSGMGSDFTIYSILWSWSPNMYLPVSMIPIFILANIWMTLPLTLLNIVYIWKIVRYYRGNCTRYSVIWVGMLSLILPTLIALFLSDQSGGYIFIGPIPLQFIAGLIFMYKIPGPEMTSPWRGDLGDRSWWKPKRPDWWYRMFPSSDEDEKKEPEPKSEWLEEERRVVNDK
jgi:hypothetical protein